MEPLKPYTVRPIRGRYLVDGPGSDGIPLTTKAQAEGIANLMNAAYEQAQAAVTEATAERDTVLAVLTEGWFQREHPSSPGVTITDTQMAEAAYVARSILVTSKLCLVGSDKGGPCPNEKPCPDHQGTITARCLPNQHAFVWVGDCCSPEPSVDLARFRCDRCGLVEEVERNEEDE